MEASSNCIRIAIDQPAFPANLSLGWNKQGHWPADWISIPAPSSEPFVAAYLKQVELGGSYSTRIHVSADERFELFVDGKLVGRGPERCDEDEWAYASFQLDLTAGHHVIVARVISLGEKRAFAQHTIRHGFLLADEGGKLSTGRTDWQAKVLGGYRFKGPQQAWGTGSNVRMHGAEFDWGHETGAGENWGPVEVTFPGTGAGFESEVGPGPLLRPSLLPPMWEADITTAVVRHAASVPEGPTNGIAFTAASSEAIWAKGVQALLAGAPLSFPAHSRIRALIDLSDYYCARPEVAVSGGSDAEIRIHWQESLFNKNHEMTKGNRDEIEGKHFTTIWSWEDGIGDTFFPSGATESYSTPWWQAGRFVELLVITGEQALTIETLKLVETRYPLENASNFESSDADLDKIIGPAYRTLQMCSHETYMDCPYYEQLQYVGDTRIQVLVTYLTSQDDRLPIQALRAFDRSRRKRGITMSRYPSRVRQIIPPFSLWWVTMIKDYALYRGDLSLLRELAPGMRSVCDYFASFIDEDGLLQPTPGWNFIDWVRDWRDGVPPTGQILPTAPVTLQFILALQAAAFVENAIGETELAARWKRLEERLTATLRQRFWVEDRGIFADDLAHENFSQHSQVLSICAGMEDVADFSLVQGEDLQLTTFYFTHYLFEAAHIKGDYELFRSRIDDWTKMLADGLKTTIEMPEPTRSDCHAWGAHPIYHYFSSVLGIRSGGLGFENVIIRPMPGDLENARGSFPTPHGDLTVAFTQSATTITFDIHLPNALSGTFIYAGHSLTLHPSENRFTFPKP